MNNLLIHIAEFFPLGKSKYAPGTVASIFTCALFYFINKMTNLEILVFILILILIIGHISIKAYLEKFGNKDHKNIVIDEVVGQYLSLMVIPFFSLEMNFQNIFITFLLFRFFDISKIGLRSIEKLPGSLGIMLDDVIAGVFVIFTVGTFWSIFYVE